MATKNWTWRQTKLFPLLVLVLFLSAPAWGATLLVDDDGLGFEDQGTVNCGGTEPTFSQIQEAVDAASPGDVIAVCAGDYAGGIAITTPQLTLRSISGPDFATIGLSICGDPEAALHEDCALDIMADEVTVVGFSFLENSTGSFFPDIIRLGASSTEIRGNVFSGRSFFAIGGAGDNHRIINNVFQNQYIAIGLGDEDGSDGNLIRGNTFTVTNIGVLLLSGSALNQIIKNQLRPDPSGQILDAFAIGGIFAPGQDNEVRENDIDGLPGVGIEIEGTAVVRSNNITNNDVGLRYVATADSPILDVQENWWGDASGPSGGVTDPLTGAVAEGLGQVIEIAPIENEPLPPNDLVAFDPWLVERHRRASGGGGGSNCGLGFELAFVLPFLMKLARSRQRTSSAPVFRG